MDLETYKKCLKTQQAVIKEHLDKARADADLIAIKVFDCKLDLINWVVSESEKIEVSKPKMREFL